MSVSKSFAEHAADLLSGAGRIESRPMFGGYGVFHRGAMFALLDDDELYVKADDENRQAFVDAGCAQWVYPSPKGPMPMGYFRPPDEAMESAEAMLPWARLGIDAAERAAQAKALKAAKAKLKSLGTGATGRTGPAGKAPTRAAAVAKPSPKAASKKAGSAKPGARGARKAPARAGKAKTSRKPSPKRSR